MKLEGRGLSLRRGERTLWSDVDVDVEAGEVVIIGGPSGVGKTSLLRILCLLDDPSEGGLTLDGVAPDVLGAPAWRRRVSLVQQRPTLGAGTVEDALARPFRYAVDDRVFEPDRARALLARLHVDETFGRAAEDLSVGEAQRVSLCRALLVEPEILLLDEPTSALDDDAVATVEEILDERRRAGGAAVVISHDRAQVERFAADRVIQLGAADG